MTFEEIGRSLDNIYYRMKYFGRKLPTKLERSEQYTVGIKKILYDQLNAVEYTKLVKEENSD